MDGAAKEPHRDCLRCGRSTKDGDVFCSGCGQPVRTRQHDDWIDQLLVRDVWERDLRQDIANAWWSQIIGGLLLIVAAVGFFLLGLVLFGGLGAYLAGIVVFISGSFALAWFFGGNKAGQSL